MVFSVKFEAVRCTDVGQEWSEVAFIECVVHTTTVNLYQVWYLSMDVQMMMDTLVECFVVLWHSRL